jgi:two-component system chemotaxis response regulator CheY
MSNPKPLKILLVDDSVTARALLSQAFPEIIKGYTHFFEAEDGMQGLELFKIEQPDMVFMDLTMPRMNGMEALIEIKKISPKAVVVMVTADRQKETKRELIDAGAFAVINKPVDRAELNEIINSIIAGSINE